MEGNIEMDAWKIEFKGANQIGFHQGCPNIDHGGTVKELSILDGCPLGCCAM
jgi:hypothetical protein